MILTLLGHYLASNALLQDSLLVLAYCAPYLLSLDRYLPEVQRVLDLAQPLAEAGHPLPLEKSLALILSGVQVQPSQLAAYLVRRLRVAAPEPAPDKPARKTIRQLTPRLAKPARSRPRH